MPYSSDNGYAFLQHTRVSKYFLLLAILAIAAVYFASAKLGFTMAYRAKQVTLVWPPSGIALASILLLGWRAWPGIALGAFLANITSHEPLITALSIATGNTLEALAGAWMLHRFVGFRNRLRRLNDVLGLLAYSAIFSTMLSATIGTTSLCMSAVQPWNHYPSLWLTWWLGDATGVLIFAPVLLVWCEQPFSFRISNLAEMGGLVIGLTFICIAIFAAPLIIGLTESAFVYLIFPFIMWAALRFGQRGVTVVTLAASLIATHATITGHGPFAAIPTEQGLALLQIFMAVMAVTGLLLAAAISERKAAEKDRAILAGIVASSDDAIIGKDPNGIIHYWNSGAERLFGYARTETIGHSIQMIIPPERQKDEDAILDRIRHSEHVEHYETVRITKDGRQLDVSVSASPIRDEQGNIIGASQLARDITERKQAEAALQEADRRKDEFLATLAHELRNPLAPLSHALSILRQPEVASPRRTEAIDIMQRQVQQMVRLVDDLLDVSRISHGKIELRREHIALDQIVRLALETSTLLIEARQHTLSVTLPQETLWVNADLMRLSQVFANLLGNAAKYTPPGGHIWLEAEAKDDNAVIRVRDDGIGITSSVLPHVFEIFAQAEHSIERAHGGLGIGLTLVKALVEMHGGDVCVHSPGINQGSEFIVQLPLAAIPSVTQQIVQPSTKSYSQRLRVLVVDDSKALAKTLGWMVELLGHEVRVEHDGESALATAHAFLPDVALLDIGLAGMNGYEVCRRMRADPALQRCIIIAQSGWGQPEHRRRSAEAGFDHHLVKPVEMQALDELLSSLGARMRS